ncbi:MAG: multiheme C-type cytochrome [Thermodesulfobacteria bacterium]|nr:multiheme C-type cytochrome [Thermodesulfobacteriota bacterium]
MRNILALMVLFLGLFLVACQTGKASKTQAAAAPSAQHPELSAREKLIPCATCHREVTPEIYEEWYNSLHGLDNVKCFQCHGTYENFAVEPPIGRCAACHAREVTHAPKNKACWDCHPAHKFTVHR